ncbi:hypothetical protein ACP4OV_031566 [Aristida adscensionis]
MSQRNMECPRLSALIIDEDKYHVDYLNYMLPHLSNIHVITYTSPMKALNFLKDHAKDVHFLLVAVSMKEMSGFQFLDIAKNMYPNIQVIMMSTSTPMDLARRCVALGARILVKKPLNAPTISNLWQHLDARSIALRMKQMMNLQQGPSGEHSRTENGVTDPTADKSAYEENESMNKGNSNVVASTESNIGPQSPLNYPDSKNRQMMENGGEEEEKNNEVGSSSTSN